MRVTRTNTSPTVDVEIDTTHLGGTGSICLSGVRTPIDYNDICDQVVQKGLARPAGFFTTNCSNIQVTDQPSTYGDSERKINLDQPLLHYYHKCFLPVTTDEGSSVQNNDSRLRHPSQSDTANLHNLNEASITHGNVINVNGVLLTFQRTVRVPDNQKTHALPPSMGAFSVYNVAEYADRLPLSIVEKGGVFISMYQREAMWISFDQEPSSHELARAVKVSVGGVNALTGIPQGQTSSGKQDYCVLNSTNAQPWLDGISTAPGVVRQFVAMPLGQGYTVEGQITGKEDVGGLQIDVYPEFDASTVEFSVNKSSNLKELNLYQTPRQQGLAVGAYVEMVDRRPTNAPRLLTPSTTPFVTSKSRLYLIGYSASFPLIHVVTVSGERISVPYQPYSLVSELIDQVAQLRKDFPRAGEGLIFDGQAMLHHRTLIWHEVFPDDTVHLIRRPVGGGPGGPVMFAQEQASMSVQMSARGRAPGNGPSEMGFAAGGTISQKISRDTLPPTAYDQDNGTRLHISVLNSADFSYVTGLPPPACPITPQTYLDLKLPWFTFYDEQTPAANNASPSSALAGVQSIASMDASRRAQGTSDTQPDCAYCSYQLATLVLEPCGHVICDDCAMGLQPNVCPSCPRAVLARKTFAAAMPLPGNEDNDGVEVGSLDDRIVALKRCAERGKVGTFRLPKHSVSPLTGSSELVF